MCPLNGRKLVAEAFKNFSPRCDHAPHHPEIGLITCIDGRLAAGGHYQTYGDKALRITEIAAIVPQYEFAPANMKAKLSFQKVKDIGVIKVEGHSFCGGAQTIFAYPTIDEAPNEDIGNIVESIAQSGADLPRLRDAFLRACEGDVVKGANLMARHLVLETVQNISEYPGVHKRIIEGRLDVLPIFHVLKEDDPDEKSYLELFDVNHQKWYYLEDLKERNYSGAEHQNTPETSQSYMDLINRSIEWVPHNIIHHQTISLPRHISDLLNERRAYYQPHYSRELNKPAQEQNIMHMACR